MEAVGGGNLLESLKAIRVRVALCAPDLMAVAFKNATLAHRGSIRQAHDVLNWIQKLEKVSTGTGSTAEDVLNKWNAECPADAKVSGNKRQCCLHLLRNVSLENRALLIEHASKYGAKSAFTDDAFSGKNILPGFKPRLATQRWVRWQTVTSESFSLMVRHAIQKFETTAETFRTKVSRTVIERSSQHAALVVGIEQCVHEQHPDISRAEAFVSNDPNLLTALDAALSEQDRNFSVMELPILSEVVIQWRKTLAGTAIEPASVMCMRVGAGELEKQEFNLWKLRVMSDMEQFIYWAKMLRAKESQSYYKRVQHNVLRAAECENAARSLLDPRHKNCLVTFVTATDQQCVMNKVQELKRHLCQTHVLPSPEAVMTLSYINWAAMSIFSAKMFKIQHSVLAATIGLDGGQTSAGLVLLPTHTYKPGLLHQQQAAAQSQLASHGVNIDQMIALSFSQRRHARVGRPRLITANLVLADDDCKSNKLAKNIRDNPVICLGGQQCTKYLVR